MFNSPIILSGSAIIADVFILNANSIIASDPKGVFTAIQLAGNSSNNTIFPSTGLAPATELQVLDGGSFIPGFSSTESFGDGSQLQTVSGGIQVGIINNSISSALSPVLFFDLAKGIFPLVSVKSGLDSNGLFRIEMVGDGVGGIKIRFAYDDGTLGVWSSSMNIFSSI